MTTVLNNGLNLCVIERPHFPKIFIRFGMNFGMKNEDPLKCGLVSLLSNTLKKGTKSKNYREIVDTIEGLGGELDSTVNEDFFIIYGEFLKDNLKIGLELLGDIMFNANFPNDEIEKERSKLLADLENEKSSPEFLANRRFDNALFSPHPYSHYKTNKSIEGLSRSDLQNFYNHYFAATNSYLVLGGDISESEAIELSEKYFGEWQKVDIEFQKFQMPVLREQPEVCLVNRPGSPQSNILLGNLLFHRGHSDFEKTLVMNKILGGGGSGRLFLHLREEKGYTYGAYSHLQTYKDTGALVANAEVRNDVTGETIHAFLEQFEKLQNQMVGSDELANAKRFLRGIFPLQNETPSSIAALTLKQYLYNLETDYWDHYLRKIDNVDTSDVQDMARNYINLDALTIIVVGDAELLFNKLSEFGEIVVYDLEDQQVN
jgi:zinc protease